MLKMHAPQLVIWKLPQGAAAAPVREGGLGGGRTGQGPSEALGGGGMTADVLNLVTPL